jgi:hypothetical protein
MCIFCILYGHKLLTSQKLPTTETTFRLSKAIYSNQETFYDMIEWSAVDYVTTRLKPLIPGKVVPLQTTGDGNCLLHAISRAIWGVEVFSNLLRKRLHEELQTNIEWYKKAAPLPGDVEAAIRQAEQKGQTLSFLHVFALSNLLKRPIIVYASDEDIENFGTGEVRFVFFCYRYPTPTYFGSRLHFILEESFFFVPLD